MAELILSVVVDILVHVAIQNLQRRGVGCAPTPAGDFVVLDSSELVVLYPEVGLEDFRRRQESENGSVSLVETAALFLPRRPLWRKRISHWPKARHPRWSCQPPQIPF